MLRRMVSRVTVRDADALVFLGALVATLYSFLALPVGLGLLIGGATMRRARDPGLRHVGLIALIVGGIFTLIFGIFTLLGGISAAAGGTASTGDLVRGLVALLALGVVIWAVVYTVLGLDRPIAEKAEGEDGER